MNSKKQIKSYNLIIGLKSVFYRAIRAIGSMIPKEKNLWLFGCWDGKLYADNSKYLFEYINKEHPNVKCVWITKNISVRDEIVNKGFKCCLRLSFQGVMYALRAQAAFITSDEISDISPLINRSHTKVIQLYHGISGKGTNIFVSEDQKKKTIKRFGQYYWMASSQKYIDVYSSAFMINERKFYITGYPRNDVFVNKPYNDYMHNLKNKYPNHRFIIYMPTHRAYGKKPIDISEFKFIDNKLKEHDIIMVYKPHYNELKNVEESGNVYSNIILAKDQNIWGDVYSYIHYFDLLISDYSSIIYDFLCADKPIVLYTYDLEDFRKNDFGIMDFFEKVPLGPFCYTWAETISNIICLLDNDTWREKRNICREMFHPFKDGKNCERVYSTTIKLLTK